MTDVALNQENELGEILKSVLPSSLIPAWQTTYASRPYLHCTRANQI
jgi:hypothetical protein